MKNSLWIQLKKNLASMFSGCSLIIGPKNIHCLPEVKQIGCLDLEDVGSTAGKHRRGQVADRTSYLFDPNLTQH